jgi:hypothetical protein
MDSYKWMLVGPLPIIPRFLTFLRFHSSRYPTKPSDIAHKFDPKTHNHIVFVRKNKFFEVSLVDAAGKELSAAELEVYVVIYQT